MLPSGDYRDDAMLPGHRQPHRTVRAIQANLPEAKG